jgi:tRNA threonylcarbamoyladenosine biosynthesis protein TsaE
MVAFGERIAAGLAVGDVLLLHGDLGAGKTTLTQGIARGLGVAGSVQSPTFTIVAEHDVTLASGVLARLYHLDLYRLTDPSELESFGYEQYLRPEDGIAVIEWPERAEDWFPERFLLVRIEYQGDGGRRVRIEPVPPDGWPGLEKLS